MVIISAIISAYHAKDFIRERLDNLLEQQLKPEIVVVCRDGSYEQKIASEYDVVLISTDNIPPLPVAWNLAVKQARGKYLTTANCDDKLYPCALRVMVGAMEESKASLCFGDSELSENGKIVPWRRLLEGRGIIENPFDKFYKRCVIGAMPVWRHELHKKYGYFDESLRIVCDWDFWLRLAEGGESFYYLRRSVGVYMHRPDSLEHKNSNLYFLERKLIRKRYEDRAKSKSTINS